MPDTTQEKRSYKKTLNLPKTAFPMKANLVQNEPASQKRWEAMNLYQKVRAARQGSPRFIFHDGPPYANGSIHLGHLLNKALKDFVVRATNMAGFDTPYVPGWDCHGLPIEHKVMQESFSAGSKGRADAQSTIAADNDAHRLTVRRACRKYAEKYVKLQSRQMQRLLTLADYDDPYLTMNPQYEAAVLEVFAQMVERGLVYRGLKPVHWSIENRTALAEAELEYYDREDTSVYVMFEVDDPAACGLAVQGHPLHLLIWTTTPWTLPANLAVAVHPRHEYGVYEVDGGYVVVATELATRLKPHGLASTDPIATLTGEQLLGLEYHHPFIDRMSRVVAAEYVTLEDGTGLVHTAPGHGTEDYQTGLREGLDIYCPVRDDGTFDDTVPDWLQGKSVWEANGLVVERLRASGHLFHVEQFTHSYPHDWRGKTPVIFRATEQWFVDVDKPCLAGAAQPPVSLRARALEVIKDVEFFPEWGRNRMRGMLESRPDWCLSRQRAWGLPIPVFYPPSGVEGEPLLTPASVRAVARVVRKRGSDAWFTMSTEELLADYDAANDDSAPAWIKAGGAGARSSARRGSDIFDVWFESGSSWHACIQQRFGADAVPTDLYLEGSDQHRGWFQLSLLPAVAVTGQAPFRGVLTHGFMVDKDGKKMSKSGGNALEVDELFKSYGADVCRWWVSSLSTDNDIKVDESYFKIAGEQYRKVRNTLRFLLSNLFDFNTDPNTEGDRYEFSLDDEMSLDAWALGELDNLIEQVKACYATHQFRKAHELLYNFCNETMSATYLAAVKDRLYCDAPDSLRRRRTQTAIFRIADALIRLLAPILPHTADEAWQALYALNTEPGLSESASEGPDRQGDAGPSGPSSSRTPPQVRLETEFASVHLVQWPEPTRGSAGADKHMPVYEGWRQFMAERERALKLIEEARASQNIDNPLDMGLRIAFSPKKQHYFEKCNPVDFADLLGISRVELEAADVALSEAKMTVVDLRDEPRCERSWKRDGTVKQRSDGGWLSDRDAEAVGV